MWVAFNEDSESLSGEYVTCSDFWEWTGTKAALVGEEQQYGNIRYVPEDATLYKRTAWEPHDNYDVKSTDSFPVVNGRVAVSSPNNLKSITIYSIEDEPMYNNPPAYLEVTKLDWIIRDDGSAILYVKNNKPIAEAEFKAEDARLDEIFEAGDEYLGLYFENWGSWLEYKPYGNWITAVFAAVPILAKDAVNLEMKLFPADVAASFETAVSCRGCCANASVKPWDMPERTCCRTISISASDMATALASSLNSRVRKGIGATP
ncbi:MAG: hypothetical protein ACOX7I_02605 [Oscillospiraceae bacterium]|jgi:hypothetical protein